MGLVPWGVGRGVGRGRPNSGEAPKPSLDSASDFSRSKTHAPGPLHLRAFTQKCLVPPSQDLQIATLPKDLRACREKGNGQLFLWGNTEAPHSLGPRNHAETLALKLEYRGQGKAQEGRKNQAGGFAHKDSKGPANRCKRVTGPSIGQRQSQPWSLLGSRPLTGKRKVPPAKIKALLYPRNRPANPTAGCNLTPQPSQSERSGPKEKSKWDLGVSEFQL